MYSFRPSLRLGLAPVLALSALVAMLFSSCGGSDDTLTIYSGRSESLVAPIIQAFSETTGVHVEVKYGSTAAMAATLLEEGDNSPADVFYAQDPGGLGAIAGLLSPLPFETLARVPEWARSPESLWVGVSGRARVLVYNTKVLAEADLPQDLEALANPKWRGRVGWAPTNGSFLTMITAMRSTWGEERALAWVQGMVANGVNVYPNNSSQVAAVGSGEINIGLVNHYYLYRFLAEEGEGFPARNYHLPDGGPGSLVMVSGAGVLDSSGRKEDAQRFVDFLLSAAAQSYFTAQTYEYPLAESIPTHRLLIPLGQINGPDIRLADLADIDGSQQLMREAGALP